MHGTQALARFVAETQFKDLPDALVEESRIVVLDTLAAGFVGTVQPWAQRLVEMVRELGGVAEATVLNQPWHTDISRAALANGAFFGAFECEPLSGSHHFEWSDPSRYEIVGTSSQGRATVSRLQMNHPDLVSIRRLLAKWDIQWRVES